MLRSQVSFIIVLCCIYALGTNNLSAKIPYVYSVENTGARYKVPTLPTLEKLPEIEPLPDPFAWINDPLGANRSTAFNDWKHHRAEIMAQIENYEIGIKPKVDPSQVTAGYANGVLTVHVTVNGKTLTLTSKVILPSGSGPFPVVIGMNSSTGSLPPSYFTERNIAQITFSHNQVTTYYKPQNTDPYYQLYPQLNIDNTGQYSAWAWGVSRIIDGLQKLKKTLPLDLRHIAVTGCSYAGKMALFAGAFDERIALTIAQESGGGGATSWRYSLTQAKGTVEGLAQTSRQWFAKQMFQFSDEKVSYLPVDHHMLMALCAPRALYVTGNTDYLWLSNQSNYVCSRAAQEVYKTLGIADRFGFGIDGGHGHCLFPAGFKPDLDYFLDKFMLGKTDLSRIAEVYPESYSGIDYKRWYSWWGTGKPILTPVQEIIPLYTSSVPNSKITPAGFTESFNNGMFRNVTSPTLEVFLPEKGTATGVAVIICPGGGYSVNVYQGEGVSNARELARNGITAFVLKYRLPDDAIMADKSIGPLQDAQQAIKLVRENAGRWNIDSTKIGIIGFSAGGHLASSAATHFEKALIDNPKGTSLRPDFQVVVYPVITMQQALTHRDSRKQLLGEQPSQQLVDLFSNELQVKENTPPAYITHAADDNVVDVDNSINYFEALRRHKVPVEMHIYPKGGHGFIFGRKGWMIPLLEWIGTTTNTNVKK